MRRFYRRLDFIGHFYNNKSSLLKCIGIAIVIFIIIVIIDLLLNY